MTTDAPDGREPDVHLRSARPGDRCLLCTDGVSAVLDEEVVVGTLGAGDPPRTTVDALLARVRAAGAPDNAACVVVDL